MHVVGTQDITRHGNTLEELVSKQGSTPTPWARGLRDQIQKGHSRHRKSFIHRFYTAQRGIETGLGPWSRKGPDHGVGVDLSLLY